MQLLWGRPPLYIELDTPLKKNHEKMHLKSTVNRAFLANIALELFCFFRGGKRVTVLKNVLKNVHIYVIT